jgi:hypothetical protein
MSIFELVISFWCCGRGVIAVAAAQMGLMGPVLIGRVGVVARVPRFFASRLHSRRGGYMYK